MLLGCVAVSELGGVVAVGLAGAPGSAAGAPGPEPSGVVAGWLCGLSLMPPAVASVEGAAPFVAPAGPGLESCC